MTQCARRSLFGVASPSEVVELCTDPIARCGSGDGLAVRIDVTRTGTVFQ